jgi:hypothetical protein
MSELLNQNLENQGPTREQRLQRLVGEIKAAPISLVNEMVNRWNRAFDQLWSESFTPVGEPITVEEKLAALGTNAAELFELNTIFTQFIITQLTGKRDDIVAQIVAKVATIPPYTVNPDGSITLDAAPE